MNIDSSINPMPARRAERSSALAGIFANRLMDRVVTPLRSVTARLVRAIRAFVPRCFKGVDARDKPGQARHDEIEPIVAALRVRYGSGPP
jgi:hypothetical protein